MELTIENAETRRCYACGSTGGAPGSAYTVRRARTTTYGKGQLYILRLCGRCTAKGARFAW